MGPIDVFLHLAGFLAPAVGVALLVSLSARLVLPATAGASSWSATFLANTLAGATALIAGLVLFGRDGKMMSYAALVLACASSQWLLTRSWK